MLEEFSLQFEYLQYRVIYPLRRGNLILETIFERCFQYKEIS